MGELLEQARMSRAEEGRVRLPVKMVLGFSCGHWDEFPVDPECEWSVGDTVACGQCNDLALVVALGGCPHHGPNCVADPREGQDFDWREA